MLFAKQVLCFYDFAKNRGRGVLLLALVLLPILAAAQGTPAGTIYGYVLDPDQRPIPGVHISIEDPNTAATRATSTIGAVASATSSSAAATDAAAGIDPVTGAASGAGKTTGASD